MHATVPVDAGPALDPPVARAEANLGRRAVRGAAVTMTGQLVKMVIQVLSVVILARLLAPADYGLLVMVTAVIGVTDIFRDFGLSAAAIQAPALSRKQQVNLFWLNTGLGALLTMISWLGAPALAAFYHRDELIAITQVMAFMFLINGLATQYRADLSRRMLFRRLVAADVAGSAIGLVVAVVMASQGYGVWSLAAQQLTQLAVMLTGVVIGAGWLPRAYDRAVSVKPFLSFGWRLAGSQLVGYVGNNIDTVMLGLRVGANSLGLYNRAFGLIMQPLGQIRGPLNTVAVPVLSKLQDQEARFQLFVARGQLALGYTLVAGMAFVAGTAGPIVSVFLGPNWTAATDVLRLLAIAGGVTTLPSVGYWVYVTKGLVDHLLAYTFISTGLRVLCVVVGVQFGIVGVAAGMALAPLLSWPLSIWWLSRRASIPVRQLWLGGIRILGFSAVLMGACLAVEAASVGLPDWSRLLLGVLVAAGTYALLAVVVPIFRADIGGVISIVRTTIGRPKARSDASLAKRSSGIGKG